jgi:hypothetical protein
VRDVPRTTVRQQTLPGVDAMCTLDVYAGVTVTVVSHRSGRGDVTIGAGSAGEADVTAALTEVEATALAALVTRGAVDIVPAMPT